MSSYHLLPEIFDEKYVTLPPYLLEFFQNNFNFTTWEYFTHFIYLWPITLLFSANSWILINW